ncbi:histidine kinase [Bacillus sp. RG28]|uniref:Histidine kinase n=1 Tax=Gottfriedia endophytica TaxID=2820819 RepID=A0A940SKJ7_9BACI|nr:histidine kinase [Gottfriedia endophytica]MBP0726526.1 histidine kinase [Gottfriedia endophytica]
MKSVREFLYHLGHLNTQKKLLIMFLFVAIIPLVTLGLISFFQSSSVVKEQFRNYNQFAGEKIQKELDRMIGDMYFSVESIKQYIKDQSSIELSDQRPKTYADFKEEINLERMIQTYQNVGIKGIYLITSSGYYYGDRNLNFEKLQKIEILNKARGKQDIEIGIYTPTHYKENNPKKVIGLVVPLKISYGALKNSYILIETDADDLFKMINVLETDLDSRISIYNQSGEYLYRTISNKKNLENDVVWTESTKTSNWKIQFRIPNDVFYKSTKVIVKVVTIGMIIAILLAVVLSYLFSKQFSSKIQKLKLAIDEVSNGIFDKKLPIQPKDEIGKLSFHFNRMVSKIKQLMEEIKKSEELKREAELKAVHYQINPHLLFNTLNTIQWKARIDGNHEISKMLIHLTKVLQGNLNFTIGLISLKEELEAIHHFLVIQELRYGPNFTCKFEMDKKLEQALIPRMTLQPMLENIFFHAFEDGRGEIYIEINEKNGCFELILKDNGKGMSKQRLETIFSPPTSETNVRGIGMYNVKQKFTIHFGKNHRIIADSIEGQGTIISIYWPKRWVGESERNTDYQSVNS